MSDIVEIARFSSEFEAQMSQARLISQNIDAKIITDNAGGTLPSLTMLASGARIYVRAEDAERAVNVLADREETDSEDSPQG